MNCKEVKQNLSIYLDGDLTPREKEKMDIHLQECAACRQVYHEFLHVSRCLKSMGQDIVAAPADFAEKVIRKIEEESVPEKRRKIAMPYHWSRWAVAAAAVAVLAVAYLNPSLMPEGTQVAVNPPAVHETVTEINNPANQMGKPATTSSNQPGTTVTDNQAGSDSSGSDSPAGGDNTSVSDPEKSNPESPNFVLLDETQRCLVTTMLVITPNQSAPVQTATNIAQSMGALTENLGEQDDGSKIKITVTGEQAETLINRLSTIGTLVSREDSNQDISQAYEQTLEKYRALSGQRDELNDAQESARLGLEKELRDWKEKTDQQVIVLWLKN